MSYSQETAHKTPVSQLFSAAFMSSLIILKGGGTCQFLMRVKSGGKISQSSHEVYYCSWVASVMGNDLSLYIVADKAIFGKVLTLCYDRYQVYYFLIGLLISSWETGPAIYQAGSWF